MCMSGHPHFEDLLLFLTLVLSLSLSWNVCQLVGWPANEIPGVCLCTVLLPLHALKIQAHAATPGLLWVLWMGTQVRVFA